MQLTTQTTCLLTALAAAAAFAESTAEWFSAKIEPTLDARRWTGTTGTNCWSCSDGIGRLNNLKGGEWLTYEAETPKSLPQDVSVFKSRVRFTAMSQAAFFGGAASQAVPGDAKGGLTILTDRSVTPAETNFYGLVDGKWTKLAGDAAAALAGWTDVEVRIWENHGRHISYKVGGEYLTQGGVTAHAAKFAGTTLGKVSLKGVCELSTLHGEAENEYWIVTPKHIANIESVFYKVGDSDDWVEISDVRKVAATLENVQLKYVAADNKYFFLSPKGIGQTEILGASVQLTGDTCLEDDSTLTGIGSAIAAVAEVVGGGKYASIGAAMTAGDRINVLSDASESVVLAKAMTLTAADGVGIAGSFTWSENGKLTIESGAYACSFDGFDVPDRLILLGGSFTQDVACVQRHCAVNRFAKPGVGDYPTRVEAGTPVGASEDVPAIYVDCDVVSAAGGAERLPSYLAGDAGNGLKRWQTYALGMGLETADVPAFAVVDDCDPVCINIGKNFEPLRSAGVAATFTLNDVAVPEAGLSIPLANVVGVVKMAVKLFVGGSLVGSTTIGANPVATSPNRMIVTVPWCADVAGGSLKLDRLFMKAGLSEGDRVEVYDSGNDAYFSWTWRSAAWVKGDPVRLVGGRSISVPEAADYSLARGQAVWFTGGGDGVVYQAGTDGACAAAMTVAAGKHWGHVANPVSGTAKSLSDVLASAPAKAVVELPDSQGKTRLYVFNGSEWGYEDYEYTEKLVLGKMVKVGTRAFKPSDPELVPGRAFWLMNEDESSNVTLNWPQASMR